MTTTFDTVLGYRCAQDSDLMRQVAAGRKDAFETLYGRYAPLVRQTLRAAFRLEQDLADLVQEIFLQVWLKAQSFDPNRGTVKSWISTIARTRALDLIRSRSRCPEIADDSQSLADTAVPREEERRRVATCTVRSAIRELPPAQRHLLHLAFYEGLSHSQIARKLDRPLGTVKTQIRTGVGLLRQSM
jgi:RNA polymerase sigma-70 factor (ECF subfamily)